MIAVTLRMHSCCLHCITMMVCECTGDCFGKAGSYGIQTSAAQFVKRVQGCYFNVMGFPVNHFSRCGTQEHNEPPATHLSQPIVDIAATMPHRQSAFSCRLMLVTWHCAGG